MCFAGSRVLSFGYNKPKTEASVRQYAKNVNSMYENSKTDYISQCRHAEVDAIKKVSDTSKIDYIIIVRKTKNGTPCMAKPCNICQQVIENAGIRYVYYSNEDGKLEQL